MTAAQPPAPRQLLERFIHQRFLGGTHTHLDPQTSLVAQRLVPSMGWLEILLFLEETFQIHVENHELSEENFGSVQALCQFVERKSELAASVPGNNRVP